jgi:zinc transport system substrate-binding protein
MKQALAGIAILVTLFAIGCSEEAMPSGKVSVVTTIFPYYDFAREVGGENVEVTLLLPPGAEAHTYEPKPSDIVKIENADLFIYNGAGLEPWAHDILEGIDNEGLAVIDASKHAQLIESYEHNDELGEGVEEPHEESEENGGYDPHLWLDFENGKKIVDAISGELSRINPANAGLYRSNAEGYRKSLDALHVSFAAGLGECNQSILISGGHNSLSYLGRDYGFSTISVFGLSPNSEPTPQKIAEITDILKEHGIRHVIFEEFIDPKVSNVLASEAGASTIMINPGHNLLQEEFKSGVTFISLMERNLESLRSALECR